MHIHSSREHAWLKSELLRIARIGVLKKIPLSQRHVSFLAALVTEHIYTFSFTYLTYLPVVLSLTVPFVDTGNGGVADQLKSHLPHGGGRAHTKGKAKNLDDQSRSRGVEGRIWSADSTK